MYRWGKCAIAAILFSPSFVFALTFTRPLSLGSTGSDVTSLQQILAQQGFLTVQPTGYFGTLTQAAVQAYQKAHDIVSAGTPATTGYGAVGPKTLASLNGTTPTSDKATLIAALMAQVKVLEAEIAAILAQHGTTTTTSGGGGSGGSVASSNANSSSQSQTTTTQTSGNTSGGGGSGSSSSSGSPSGGSNTTSATCPKGASYADGCADAPTGTPQFPTLFSSYSTRPAWNVAGVDYYVGLPSGLTLADPSVQTNLPSCAAANSSTHIVTINSNNCTLSGFDFSLHGGWGIQFGGGGVSGAVIENNKFVIGTNAVTPINGCVGGNYPISVTIKDNEFKGNFISPSIGIGIICFGGSGSSLHNILYNEFDNIAGDVVDFTNVPGIVHLDYNFVNSYGTSGHPDFVQFGSSQGGSINFNTIYQGQNVSVPNTALAVAAQGGTTVQNMTVENNVAICTGPNETCTYPFAMANDSQSTTKNIVFQNNYYDPTGEGGGSPFYTPNGTTNNWGTNNVLTNFTNLVTGQNAVIPTSPVPAPFASDVLGVSASPASGVFSPGSTITVTLNMAMPYTVVGAPTLSFNNGGSATYASGSGTNSLVFSYTIEQGQTTDALAITAINLNGGAITDAVGNAANMSGILRTLSGVSISGSSSSSSSSVTQPANTTASSTSSSCSQATAFLSRISVDAAHQSDYMNLICGLVADGVWSKLDAFYIFATQNSSAALTNLVNSTYVATANGAPTFTTDQGYTTASGKYVDTGFNLSTGTHFTQNSATIGVWSLTSSGSYSAVIQAADAYGGGAVLSPRDSSCNLTNSCASGRLNSSGGFATPDNSVTTAAGLFMGIRPDSATYQIWQNNSQIGTNFNSISVAPDNADLETAGDTTNGNNTGTLQIAAIFAGAALNATDVSNLYSLLHAYMQSVGATP